MRGAGVRGAGVLRCLQDGADELVYEVNLVGEVVVLVMQILERSFRDFRDVLGEDLGRLSCVDGRGFVMLARLSKLGVDRVVDDLLV